jgi:hypothetical protein
MNRPTPILISKTSQTSLEFGIHGNKIHPAIIIGVVIHPNWRDNNTSKPDKRKITTIVVAQ